MRKYLMELLGTFFLMLAVSLVILESMTTLGPVAIGLTLMVFVYAGGAISGGHYNPAVTLAAWIRGAIAAREVVPYMAAQLIGAFVAAYVAPLTLSTKMVATIQHPAVVPTMLAEAIFTFALVFVVLNTATARANQGNSYFGLAIGLTVTAGALVVGPISGGVFNPAVAFGLTVLGSTPPFELPLFIIAQLVGGALAAAVFLGLRPTEKA